MSKIRVSPLTWHKKFLRGNEPPFRGQPVPCGSCTACCETGRVVLYPPYDNPATFAHHREVNGALVLERHPDGHCLYLHEGQCLIYERRPMTCRLFDCRALLIADVMKPETVFHAAGAKFEIQTDPKNRAFLQQVRMKARIAEVQGKSSEQQIQQALLT